MKVSILSIALLMGVAISGCGKKEKSDSGKGGNNSGDAKPALALAADTEFGGQTTKQEDGSFAYIKEYAVELTEKMDVTVNSAIGGEACEDPEGFFLFSKEGTEEAVDVGAGVATLDAGTYTMILVAQSSVDCLIGGVFSVNGSEPLGNPIPNPIPEPTPTPQPNPVPNPVTKPEPEPQSGIDQDLVGTWSFDYSEGGQTISATMQFSAEGAIDYKFTWNGVAIEDYKATSTQKEGKWDITIKSSDPEAETSYPAGTVLKCLYQLDEGFLERGCNEGSYPPSIDEADEVVGLQKAG